MLNFPYHYNAEYIQESGLDVSQIPQLNEFNQKILNIHNLLSGHNVSFEFALSVEFKEISRSQVYYICNALTEINKLVEKYQKYKAEQEQYKQKVKELVKK